MSEKTKTQKDVPLNAQEELAEFARTALVAIVLAVIVRTFFYEPFNIPSGSMMPTLEVGDYLFVNKPAYGYSKHSFPFSLAPINGRVLAKEPARGDVIVFKLPTNPRIDYIKRVVGMPGDNIQMYAGRLYINDKMVPRESIGMRNVYEPELGTVAMMHYRETLPGGVVHDIYEESDAESLDTTGEYNVPPGHYFVMGDNRDNSQDSRVQNVVGYVPFENIVGKADFLFFSAKEEASVFEPWRWPWMVRYSRIFKGLSPEHVKDTGE